MLSLIIWIIYLVITLILVFLLKYKHHLKNEKIIAIIIVLGVSFGLALAIYKLITAYSSYLIFNLIAEPALFAIIGGLIATTIRLLFFNNKEKLNREEVENGRTKNTTTKD